MGDRLLGIQGSRSNLTNFVPRLTYCESNSNVDVGPDSPHSDRDEGSTAVTDLWILYNESTTYVGSDVFKRFTECP
jgi:hypothetical protein